MVVDSSALVAIHLEEPGYKELVWKVFTADAVLVGTPTLFETAMVLSTRFGYDSGPMIAAFLLDNQVQVVPFSQEHLHAATAAFLRFGKGRHKACLNFGDCMSYAVASIAGMPLLFTGRDFTLTDIVPA